MNARKNIMASSKLKEAKVINLKSHTRNQKEEIVQKTISEVYFDSLKEIDELISNEGSELI